MISWTAREAVFFITRLTATIGLRKIEESPDDADESSSSVDD